MAWHSNRCKDQFCRLWCHYEVQPASLLSYGIQHSDRVRCIVIRAMWICQHVEWKTNTDRTGLVGVVSRSPTGSSDQRTCPPGKMHHGEHSCNASNSHTPILHGSQVWEWSSKYIKSRSIKSEFRPWEYYCLTGSVCNMQPYQVLSTLGCLEHSDGWSIWNIALGVIRIESAFSIVLYLLPFTPDFEIGVDCICDVW